MQKLVFNKKINASAKHVYVTMLGLIDKATYKYWTATFNPSSTYEGSWDKNAKILFVGTDEQGKKAGMVSTVDEHIPAKLVVIRHYGFVNGDEEITTGEQVEKWQDGQEIYKFDEVDGATTVTVELDTIDEYVEYFNEKYPLAMDKIKEIAEK